jgi:hypothetical protein
MVPMRTRQWVLLREVATCSVFLLTVQGCRQQGKPLSPCRAKVLRHADDYVSRHIPDSQWQPIIEAEMQKCIEEEKSKVN